MKNIDLHITAARLQEWRACPDQYKLFVRCFPNGVTLTRELLVKHASSFDLDWLVRKLVPEEQWPAYLDADSAALVVFDKAIVVAFSVYEKARGIAAAAYIEVTEAAAAVYEKAMADARAAYDEATAPARAAYDKAGATALADVLKLPL